MTKLTAKQLEAVETLRLECEASRLYATSVWGGDVTQATMNALEKKGLITLESIEYEKVSKRAQHGISCVVISQVERRYYKWTD